MSFARTGTLLVLIVAVAAVCGCASSPPATGPGPTATPGVLRSSALIDVGRIHWFEYHMATVDGVGATASDIRFDYTTSVIAGIVVKDDRMTMKMGQGSTQVVLDSYYDPASNTQVGSHMLMTSEGTTVMDQNLAAMEDQYRSSDIESILSSSDWPLSDAGTEVVTIDGKPYTCTRYLMGDAGEYGTAWVSRGVPVPVKIELRSASGTSTWELSGWG